MPMSSLDDVFGRSSDTSTFNWDSLFVDVSNVPENGYGYFQLVTLLLIYFSLLWLGSYLIVTGTELLIFLPGMSSVVGSIILPVLGQLPMILLSVFAGFGADAQAELEVGVGALAGGIVGQVSIYGYLTILLGSVNLDPTTGMTDYSKASKKRATTTYTEFWLLSGIKSGKYTALSTIYALVTAFPFVILLVPNIMYAEEREADLSKQERPYDIFAFVFAYLLFCMFSINQYIIMTANDDLPYFDVKDQLMSESVRRKLVSLMSVLSKEVQDAEDEDAENEATRNRERTQSTGEGTGVPRPVSPAGEDSPLVTGPSKPKKARMRQLKIKLQRIITPFFTAETVTAQMITLSDLLLLFHELGEKHMSLLQLEKIFAGYLAKSEGLGATPPSSVDNSMSGGLTVGLGDRDRGGGGIMSGLGGIVSSSRATRNRDLVASQTLSIDNVFEGLANFLTHYKEFHGDETSGSSSSAPNINPLESTMEDMGEFPQDLNEFSKEEQEFYLRVRSAIFLTCGLLLSIYAVDPIILTMDELSDRLGISAYYISFVVVGGIDVPTLLAVLKYGTKRSERTVSICQDTVLGSVITLNTLGLGTFMAIVYSQGLAWEYLAEGVAILSSLILASVLYFKEVMTMLDGMLLLLLFPIALGVVAIMRSYGYT